MRARSSIARGRSSSLERRARARAGCLAGLAPDYRVSSKRRCSGANRTRRSGVVEAGAHDQLSSARVVANRAVSPPQLREAAATAAATRVWIGAHGTASSGPGRIAPICSAQARARAAARRTSGTEIAPPATSVNAYHGASRPITEADREGGRRRTPVRGSRAMKICQLNERGPVAQVRQPEPRME